MTTQPSPKSSVDVINAGPILTNNSNAENPMFQTAGNPSAHWGSQVPNNCSLPKSVENNTEKPVSEKHTDATYSQRKEKCKKDLEILTGQALNLSYPSEYKTWSNSKNRSKKLKDITGPHWGPELEAFPGPDGHPNSPTCGHLKFPHPDLGVTMG